jgi:hypothetical protein
MYFDEAYLCGYPLAKGTKLLAAVGHRWAALHRSGSTGLLSRARRALQGWHKMCPPESRLPLPWPAVAGIVAALISMNERGMAIAVLLACDAYLRPGELLDLTVECVIPPQPMMGAAYQVVSLLLAPTDLNKPTKTQVFNESVLLDSRDRPWLGPLLVEWCSQFGPGQRVFPFRDHEFRAKVTKAASLAGLEKWKVTPYLFRHSGPSHDCLTRARDLMTIKKRGRWRSDVTVARYEKAARVTSRLTTLSPAAIHKLESADRNLLRILRRSAQSPFPCPLPVRKKRR